MQKTAIVIPARYASSRYPGKPLVDILGQSLLLRVFTACKRAAVADVYIATDDQRIASHCHDHDMPSLMTSDKCLTGTDRVYEASEQLDHPMIINVQGDEPLLAPSSIAEFVNKAWQYPDEVVNAQAPITNDEDYFSLSVPKVASTQDGRLLYMSRAAIPGNKKGTRTNAFKQVCMYSFPRPALRAFYENGKKTPLEAQEDIEILRFLELGYQVRMVEAPASSVAVDTPEDRDRVEVILRAQPYG